MKKTLIQIYKHPNPHVRSFLTHTEISAYRVEKLKRPFVETKELMRSRLGRIGSQVAEDLMALSGVEEIHMKPKEIRIKKRVSTPWESIENQILEIIRRALRRKQIRVIKG